MKALVGNLESWWWEDQQPSVPFTPGLSRTVQLAVDYPQVGLTAGCWKFVPLFVHDGTVPATESAAAVGGELFRGDGTGAKFELSVGPRGMGLWELRAC